MLTIISLALAFSVGLVQGTPGCHWDPLAPIFLQQEEEGAFDWSFTLGEPSTVPNVLGLERILKTYWRLVQVGLSINGCLTVTSPQCFTTTPNRTSGLSSTQTLKASVAGFIIPSGQIRFMIYISWSSPTHLISNQWYIPSGKSPLPELQTSLVPHHEVLGMIWGSGSGSQNYFYFIVVSSLLHHWYRSMMF